jgi:hypothetical protein
MDNPSFYKATHLPEKRSSSPGGWPSEHSQLPGSQLIGEAFSRMPAIAQRFISD